MFYVPGRTQSEQKTKIIRIETRKAGFQFLFKILKLQKPDDIKAFLEEYLLPHLRTAQRPISWLHKPEEKLMKQEDYSGIRNLGNVCYMISALQ